MFPCPTPNISNIPKPQPLNTTEKDLETVNENRPKDTGGCNQQSPPTPAPNTTKSQMNPLSHCPTDLFLSLGVFVIITGKRLTESCGTDEQHPHGLKRPPDTTEKKKKKKKHVEVKVSRPSSPKPTSSLPAPCPCTALNQQPGFRSSVSFQKNANNVLTLGATCCGFLMRFETVLFQIT